MIEFVCQKLAKDQLVSLSESRSHSILLYGPSGCGKTYLAKYYSQLLGITDFQIIQSNVGDIRDTLSTIYNLSSDTVICIENIDSGVLASAYTLLKLLEEPPTNVYLVVTACNLSAVPDPIISRCFLVSVNSPTNKDIETYSTVKDVNKYNKFKLRDVWNGVRDFSNVDCVYNMSDDQIGYFDTLRDIFTLKDTISTTMWKLQHYRDNTECPLILVLNCLLYMASDLRIKKYLIFCINDIQRGSIAKHIVLAKFLFDFKYGV